MLLKKIAGVKCARIPRTTFLNFVYRRNLNTGTPQNQCNPLLRSFSLQLTFFQNSRFTETRRKLFDIRFSYKHCNFSHVCLLVKIASKTVTRSIHKNNGNKNDTCLEGWGVGDTHFTRDMCKGYTYHGDTHIT